MMKKTRRKLMLLAATLPMVQLAGCTLFDGGLLERTLTGAIFDPLAAQVFQAFYNLGAGL